MLSICICKWIYSLSFKWYEHSVNGKTSLKNSPSIFFVIRDQGHGVIFEIVGSKNHAMGSGQSDGGVVFSMAHFQGISRTKKDLFLRPPQVYLYGLHLGASFFPVKKSVRNLWDGGIACDSYV